MKRASIAIFVCVAASCFFLFSLGRTLRVRLGHQAGPYAVMEPMDVDVGSVTIGQEVRTKIVLHNRGGARLLVGKPKSSCQCVVSELETRSIEPGSSVSFEIVFLPRTAGPQKQTLVIKTNDPENKMLVFNLRADGVAGSTVPAGL